MKKMTMKDDWQEMLGFLPQNWRELAQEHGALKGLRKDKSVASLLRTILLHCACGYSLRETSVRAKEAGLANISDVALMKRLKKCGSWLRAMCIALLNERGIGSYNAKELYLRVFDATHIKEPGQTGSQWRLHYSICLPDLECDFFQISSTKGKGCGESLCKFPIDEGDYILADRAYCKGKDIEYLARNNAFITVRLKPDAVILTEKDGSKFSIITALKELTEVGQTGEWDVSISGKGGQAVAGRICAMRKPEESAARSRKKSIRNANKNSRSLRESTLFYSNYIVVFTTFGREHTAIDILNYYRLRWQIELVFKRFKQIAGLGHLPKHDDESSKAWLYGKLLVALLTEKLLAYGGAISPWRSKCDEMETNTEQVAGICFYVPPTDRSYSPRSRFMGHAFKLA